MVPDNPSRPEQMCEIMRVLIILGYLCLASKGETIEPCSFHVVPHFEEYSAGVCYAPEPTSSLQRMDCK